MRNTLGRVCLIGSLGLIAVAPLWAQPAPVRPPVPALAAQVEPATPEEREVQQLLHQLNAVGEALIREVQSPTAWKLQVQQADLLLQIAHRSKGSERENFLRMAI